MARDTSWDDPQLSDGDMGIPQEKLTLESINEFNHRVLFNKKLIGYFIMDVDGYYYFEYVTTQNGLWTSYSLRMVANLLEEMNKPYEDKIKEYFKTQS